MVLVQKEVKKVFRGADLIRPVRGQGTPVTNYIPTMTANSQDGFVALSSALLGGGQPYSAFNTANVCHSTSIGSGGWGYSQIELPVLMSVSSITVHSRTDDRYNPQLPVELELTGSEDGYTFSTVRGVQNPFTAYNEEQTWSVNDDTPYKYWRLRLQAGTSGHWAIQYWNISGMIFTD